VAPQTRGNEQLAFVVGKRSTGRITRESTGETGQRRKLQQVANCLLPLIVGQAHETRSDGLAIGVEAVATGTGTRQVGVSGLTWGAADRPGSVGLTDVARTGDHHRQEGHDQVEESSSHQEPLSEFSSKSSLNISNDWAFSLAAAPSRPRLEIGPT